MPIQGTGQLRLLQRQRDIAMLIFVQTVQKTTLLDIEDFHDWNS